MSKFKKEIDMLLGNHKVSKLLDDVTDLGCNAKDAAAWILTDCAGILRKDGKTLGELELTAEKLSAIIKLVEAGTINRISGKKVLTAVIENDVDVAEYVKAEGLDRKVDTSMLDGVIDKVISENTKAVEDFKNGKVKAIQSLFGACMKELKGAGDPAVIKEMLENKLK